MNAGHVLDGSLGYYLNPLVNVVLGMAVFGDRLRRVMAGNANLPAQEIVAAAMVELKAFRRGVPSEDGVV